MSGSSQNGANNSSNYDIAVNIDPRVIPIQSSRGTIARYIPDDGSSPILMLKQDDGKTTNWVVFAGGPGGDVISVNGFTGVVTLLAINIPYNNTVSGLSATDVQGAIDELAAGGGGANVTLSNLVSPTAVNQDLILDAGKTLIIPNAITIQARNAADTANLTIIGVDSGDQVGVYDGSFFSPPAINVTSRVLQGTAGGDPSLNWGNRVTIDGASINSLDWGARNFLDIAGAVLGGWSSGFTILTTDPGAGSDPISIKTGVSAGPSGSIIIGTGNSTAPGFIRLQLGDLTTGAGFAGFISIRTGENLGTGSRSGGIGIGTGNTAGAFKAGDIQFTSGSSTGGGAGGNIDFFLGGGGGGAGRLTFRNAGEGIGAGAVWTLTDTLGSGQWQAAGAGFANQSLSNLTNPTAINQDLFAGPGLDLNLRTLDQAASPTHSVQIIVGNINGAVANQSAGSISIGAGSSNDSGSTNSGGGNVSIFAGNSQGDISSSGGSISINAGSANLGAGGGINIIAGNTQADQPPGDININAGNGSGVGAVTSAGNISILSGALFDVAAIGPSGNISLLTGDNSTTTAGASGLITISTGPTMDGPGGGIQIFSADPIGAGNSGQGFFRTGNTIAGSSGSLDMSSGGVVGVGSAGNTGPVSLVTGSITDATSTGLVGNIILETGDNAGTGVTGDIQIIGGAVTNVTSTSATGLAAFVTGANAGLGETGAVTIFSGDITNPASSATTGQAGISTGANAGTGPSGDISFNTGATTTGQQGAVRIAALSFVLPIHAADPTGTFTGGETYYNSVTGLVRYYNGVLATWSNL